MTNVTSTRGQDVDSARKEPSRSGAGVGLFFSLSLISTLVITLLGNQFNSGRKTGW